MDITHFFALLGGLACFLYGMDLMSNGLELVAGDRLHKIIEGMTKSIFRGLLVGIVVTAAIQSSSGTTVMVVGFVNAGLMTLQQAVGVIMGANIGTTVTGQLVALNITAVAPIFAFIGFILNRFVSKNSIKYLGQVILGLGFLFMGMELMSTAMAPLREYEGFRQLMITMSNPIIGILVGALVTGLIQSSAASLGILQAIANEGLIGLTGSMYIICGFNIGTCITSVLSAIGTSKNAQRTAAVHVLFNFIGTIIFVLISFVVPIDTFIESISRNLPAAQIANMHTFFNIMATLILLPFSRHLAKLATMVVSGDDKEQEEMALQYINPRRAVTDASVEITDIRAETNRMLAIAKDNFKMAMELLVNFDHKKYDLIFHNEDILNFLNSKITKHIIDCLSLQMDENMAGNFTGYMRIVRDIERIGDHIKAAADIAKATDERKLSYTEKAVKEMESIQNSINTMFNTIGEDITYAERINRLRFFTNRVDGFVTNYRNTHIERMKNGECDPESGLLFDKCLTSLERISAYLYNVGKLII